ncbi:NAD(P)/FAD-dependent oxidoreductase [Spelaeicoccus albus]|uniref:Glycine/D-amino acid oxidase-like deaminating enzyme n=1 Tax=Spelaeicoccus albus TaxID=1280376 RepID=A0A7Z0D2L4_9MICO|nr:FAD-binding oxidoreductase [Spelaeicoccus albus]NYI67673.1 glycine/D-amino acid oxidase-like deaminating enzyme [Spelaeicoccus albus]
MTQAVVVGAGIVGAACAYYLSAAGIDVTVVDRGQIGAGTTSRGEGNILVSDKGPGPELELMRLSRTLWLDLAGDVGAAAIELERKGGLVVATSPAALGPLHEFAAAQAAAGVRTVEISRPTDFEPHVDPGLPGGVLYPEDMQVQPVLAAAHLLASARQRGARVMQRTAVHGVRTDSGGAVTGIDTSSGPLRADVIVNAAGTWGGEVGEAMGAGIPVLPRKGYVLVTEPLPTVVRRKVYSADYVANVSSSDAGLETSCVVEGTRGGTVLIGASRQRVGYDTTIDAEVVSTLARQAVTLFPMLKAVNLMRVYCGFRPYCPDHLPVIGPDRRVPGVYHACGHEGAGVGLAPATGYAVTRQILGQPVGAPMSSFSPDRFVGGAAA